MKLPNVQILKPSLSALLFSWLGLGAAVALWTFLKSGEELVAAVVSAAIGLPLVYFLYKYVQYRKKLSEVEPRTYSLGILVRLAIGASLMVGLGTWIIGAERWIVPETPLSNCQLLAVRLDVEQGLIQKCDPLVARNLIRANTVVFRHPDGTLIDWAPAQEEAVLRTASSGSFDAAAFNAVRAQYEAELGAFRATRLFVPTNTQVNIWLAAAIIAALATLLPVLPWRARRLFAIVSAGVIIPPMLIWLGQFGLTAPWLGILPYQGKFEVTAIWVAFRMGFLATILAATLPVIGKPFAEWVVKRLMHSERVQNTPLRYGAIGLYGLLIGAVTAPVVALIAMPAAINAAAGVETLTTSVTLNAMTLGLISAGALISSTPKLLSAFAEGFLMLFLGPPTRR